MSTQQDAPPALDPVTMLRAFQLIEKVASTGSFLWLYRKGAGGQSRAARALAVEDREPEDLIALLRTSLRLNESEATSIYRHLAPSIRQLHELPPVDEVLDGFGAPYGIRMLFNRMSGENY